MLCGKSTACKPFDLQAVKKITFFFCFVFIPPKHSLQTELQQEQSDVWAIKHGMNIDDTGHSHFAWFGGKILLKGTIRSLLSTLSSRLHCLCKEMGSLKNRLLLLSSRAMSNRQRHWGTPSAALRPTRGQREAQDTVSVKILRFFSSHRVREQKKKKKSLKLHFIFIFIFQLKRLLFSHEKGRQPTCGFSRPSQRNQQWNVEQLGSFLALHRQGGERKKDFQILKQELQLLPWQKFSWEQAGRQLSSDCAGWKSGSEQRNGCDTQQHCCLPNKLWLFLVPEKAQQCQLMCSRGSTCPVCIKCQAVSLGSLSVRFS